MTKDLLDKFIAIEKSVSKVQGPFKLFALVSPSDNSQAWDILVSAEWGDGDNSLAMIKVVANEVQSRLTKDDIWSITRVATAETSSDFVMYLTETFPTSDGAKFENNVYYDGVSYQIYLIVSRPKNPVGGTNNLVKANYTYSTTRPGYEVGVSSK